MKEKTDEPILLIHQHHFVAFLRMVGSLCEGMGLQGEHTIWLGPDAFCTDAVGMTRQYVVRMLLRFLRLRQFLQLADIQLSYRNMQVG